MIFYTAVDLKLIMIFWHIMMQVKMCLKKKLLTIQTWARCKSMKLRLLSIRMLMIWKSYDSEKLVDDFLLNVKNRVGRSNHDFLVQCRFSLENKQPSPFENEQPKKNSKYWSTGQQQTKSFNDYLF